MNKRIWIIANFKSNKNLAEVLEWIGEVGSKVPRQENIKLVVCPTFTALEEAKKAIQVGNFPLMVGSQDLSPFEPGAYTGEEAAVFLKGLVDISILGHSERRQNFGETDKIVAEKVAQAVENQIIPLVCVQGKETPVPDSCKLVAYEPVFAIGTGTPDTPEKASEVAKEIKSRCSNDLEVLYGGSVNSTNCKKFIDQENINGLLIGKASLDAQEFIKIVEGCCGY